MRSKLSFVTFLIVSLLFFQTGLFAQIGIWTSAAELAALPMTGPAWEAVRAGANQDCSRPQVFNQNDDTNAYVLAAAIVYARTGETSYREKVVVACEKLIAEGLPRGESLDWARETGAYAMAADLVGYRTAAWERWLRKMAEDYVARDGLTMLSMYKERPNNVGSYAFGSLAAIYIFLKDSVRLHEVRDYWIKGVLGPNPGFAFSGDFSWHADPANPRLINPKGAMKQGFNIDGLIPDDMRRGAAFQTPPLHTEYPWGFMQGQVMAARILERAGLPIWAVGDYAIYRAAYALQVRLENDFGGWAANNDDVWILPFLDMAYATKWSSFQAQLWGHGKNAGWGYVVWDGKSYKPRELTVNVSGSGRVKLDPTGGIYRDSTMVKMEAVADAGWQFAHWSADLTGTANPARIRLDKSKRVQAAFVSKIGAALALKPVDDVYVQEGNFALLNYGAENKLRVKEGEEDDDRVYLKFDLTGVRGAIYSAELKLHCKALPDNAPAAAAIFAVPDDQWRETTVTWNSAPSAGRLLDSRTGISMIGATYTFDVTDFVAAELAGDMMVTVLVKDAYQLRRAVDFSAKEGANPPLLIIKTGTTGVGTLTTAAVPHVLQLQPNYPNPFQRATHLRYRLHQPAQVKINVYNANGRLVSTIIEGVQSSGNYSYVWLARDTKGRPLPAGIYFGRLQAGTQMETIKLLLLR